VRLLFAAVGLPLAALTTLFAPAAGVSLLAVLYYVRPSIWGAPEWLRPVELLTIAALAGLLLSRARGRLSLRLPGTAVLGLLLVGSAFLSAHLAAVSPALATERAVVYAKCAVTGLLVLHLFASPDGLRRFAWCVVAGTLWLVKSAVVLWFSAHPDRVDTIGGQGNGANFLALMIVLSLPILLVMIRSGRRIERLAALALLPLWVFSLAISGSRGGFLAAAAVALLFVAASRGRVAALSLAGLAGALLFLLAPDGWRTRMETIGEYGKDLSARSRLELWEVSVRISGEHPVLGVGPENFRLVSPRYTSLRQARTGAALVAHNTFLQTLAEQGALGLALLLATFASAAFAFRRAARAAPPTPEGRRFRDLCFGLLLSLAGFAACSMTLSNLHVDPLWWWFGLAPAAVAASRRLATLEEVRLLLETPAPAAPPRRSVLFHRAPAGALGIR
jgi:probable O-glycosylation ligase (exosortase A-associated)